VKIDTRGLGEECDPDAREPKKSPRLPLSPLAKPATVNYDLDWPLYNFKIISQRLSQAQNEQRPSMGS